ncbi:cobalt ABC transporter permease [Salmonella enterica]|nr:cobalt ABC transporter permease [Salmonella enterica]EGD1202684.1 cobalt ABC transporter permease [Salmonella enterica]EGJ4156470.1 cobalt ABC transporter permease [Salmonella enterica]EGU7069863.1 cobalt ABC transporter permease [Salmonella enterica]EIF0778070.1 cobalt ABC transporter permease [Salmonella enterica]
MQSPEKINKSAEPGLPEQATDAGTNPADVAAVNSFSLEAFEWQAQSGDTEPACRALLFLLNQLDRFYGQWGADFHFCAPDLPEDALNRHLCTRLAGAITTLFSRPGFSVSDDGYVQLMNYHRWLALIFAVSSYGHGDHIIRNINAAGGGVIDPLTLNGSNLKLFCLCYYPDSRIALQPDALWQYDRRTVARLFFALISARALPTPAAHGKREQLLAWLPSHLSGLDSLDFLPTAVLHDVVMHCSYADLPGKHAIKQHINRLITQHPGHRALASRLPFSAPPARSRPVVAVVLEWFTCQHSIYRTHSTTMRALREHFHVIGLAQEGATDAITQSVFDEFIAVQAATAVADIVDRLAGIVPDVVYYPSVGMFPLTLYLVNLRLAPVQLMALGHPATTWSGCIDGVLVEEDYLGDPACFSEQVYPLPVDALPYLPPAHTQRVVPERKPFTERQWVSWPFAQPVRIAVCASIMKVNPVFLNTLAEISRRSRVPLQFCFWMGFAQGLTVDYLREAIHAVLPTAEVNAHMPVQLYQQALNSCDLFVSPFPFGNTNGLVDTVRQGLPGVCLSGPEVHTHIDEGLFRRLGLPEALIASDTESYIRAVLKLAEDTEWREELQRHLRENDVEQVLFTGHPDKFAEVVRQIYLRAGGGEGAAGRTECSGTAQQPAVTETPDNPPEDQEAQGRHDHD